MDDRQVLARRYSALMALGFVPFLFNGWINSLIYDIPVLYWTLELLLWVVLPVVIFRLAFRAGLTWDELGIGTRLFGGQISVLRVLATVPICLAVLLIDKLAFRWFQVAFADPGIFSYAAVLPASGPLRTALAVYMALSAGIVEELYYRGLMFRICRLYAWPKLLYLCSAPLLFAAIHWENGVDAILATWTLGVVYGLAFFWLRNLVPLIAVHALSDYIAFH